MRPISLMMAVLILVMSDRSLAQDCLLGYVTPMHGDPAEATGPKRIGTAAAVRASLIPRQPPVNRAAQARCPCSPNPSQFTIPVSTVAPLQYSPMRARKWPTD